MASITSGKRRFIFWFSIFLLLLSLGSLLYTGVRLFRSLPDSSATFMVYFVVLLIAQFIFIVSIVMLLLLGRDSSYSERTEDTMPLEELTVKDPELSEMFAQFKQLSAGLESNLEAVEDFKKKMEARFAEREREQKIENDDVAAWQEELSLRSGEAGKFAIFEQIVKAFDSVSSRKELYDYIIEMSAKMTHSARASIMTVDAGGEALSFYSALGWQPDSEIKSRKVPFGEGLAGDVAKNNKRMLVSDVEAEVGRGNKPGYRSKSFIILPIVCGQEVCAVLNLTDKPGGSIYNLDDLELLNGLIGLASLALKGVH